MQRTLHGALLCVLKQLIAQQSRPALGAFGRTVPLMLRALAVALASKICAWGVQRMRCKSSLAVCILGPLVSCKRRLCIAAHFAAIKGGYSLT